MKLDFLKSTLILLSLGIVGCNTAAPGGGSATATATGAVVAQANMPEYCQNAAASQYGAGNITTQSAVARSFGFLVEGTADTGLKTYIFNCRFDAKGAFLGISEV
jgi:hypothetical protein